MNLYKIMEYFTNGVTLLAGYGFNFNLLSLILVVVVCAIMSFSHYFNYIFKSGFSSDKFTYCRYFLYRFKYHFSPLNLLLKIPLIGIPWLIHLTLGSDILYIPTLMIINGSNVSITLIYKILSRLIKNFNKTDFFLIWISFCFIRILTLNFLFFFQLLYPNCVTNYIINEILYMTLLRIVLPNLWDIFEFCQAINFTSFYTEVSKLLKYIPRLSEYSFIPFYLAQRLGLDKLSFALNNVCARPDILMDNILLYYSEVWCIDKLSFRESSLLNNINNLNKFDLFFKVQTVLMDVGTMVQAYKIKNLGLNYLPIHGAMDASSRRFSGYKLKANRLINITNLPSTNIKDFFYTLFNILFNISKLKYPVYLSTDSWPKFEIFYGLVKLDLNKSPIRSPLLVDDRLYNFNPIFSNKIINGYFLKKGIWYQRGKWLHFDKDFSKFLFKFRFNSDMRSGFILLKFKNGQIFFKDFVLDTLSPAYTVIREGFKIKKEFFSGACTLNDNYVSLSLLNGVLKDKLPLLNTQISIFEKNTQIIRVEEELVLRGIPVEGESKENFSFLEPASLKILFSLPVKYLTLTPKPILHEESTVILSENLFTYIIPLVNGLRNEINIWCNNNLYNSDYKRKHFDTLIYKGFLLQPNEAWCSNSGFRGTIISTDNTTYNGNITIQGNNYSWKDVSLAIDSYNESLIKFHDPIIQEFFIELFPKLGVLERVPMESNGFFISPDIYKDNLKEFKLNLGKGLRNYMDELDILYKAFNWFLYKDRSINKEAYEYWHIRQIHRIGGFKYLHVLTSKISIDTHLNWVYLPDPFDQKRYDNTLLENLVWVLLAISKIIVYIDAVNNKSLKDLNNYNQNIFNFFLQEIIPNLSIWEKKILPQCGLNIMNNFKYEEYSTNKSISQLDFLLRNIKYFKESHPIFDEIYIQMKPEWKEIIDEIYNNKDSIISPDYNIYKDISTKLATFIYVTLSKSKKEVPPFYIIRTIGWH